MRRAGAVSALSRLMATALLLFAGIPARATDVRIGVLGLFHSTRIIISPVEGTTLECGSGAARQTVYQKVKVYLKSPTLIMDIGSNTSRSSILTCDDGRGGDAEFTVAVPERISRRYRGRLEISPQKNELGIVITIDLETAVASVVAAESAPQTPLEALKAQAVAARSFFVAGKGRHARFDFCDTTHCQFLRAPARAGSPAVLASAATRGMVLAYHDQAFAAMYSASCGGQTHSLDELGIAVRDYPYFSVTCTYCRRHPQKWVRELSREDAAGLKSTEGSRIQMARKLGWKAIPSNSYASHEVGSSVVLEGVGLGHGVGLCQRGAADMARQGASYPQILEHYYPNTTLKLY